MTSPDRRRSGVATRWRVPLAAAAAVAAVALATAAIVTGSIGATGQGAATGRGAATPAGAPAPSTVGASHIPIRCPADPSDAVTVPVAAAATRKTTGGGKAPAAPVARLFFVGGAPPSAGLCGTFSEVGDGGHRGDPGDGGGDPGGTALLSDGTPLGYASISGGADGSSRYLWGAVGPDVALAEVAAVRAPTAADPGFSLATGWVIGPPADTGAHGPSAVGWIGMGRGWHGFAIQLPPHTVTVTLTAHDAGGTVVQRRSVEVATRTVSDDTARRAGSAATAGPTGRPTGTLVVAPSDDPCASVPLGRGEIRADDEGTPVLAHLDEAGTTLCFSEGADWYAARPVTDQRDQLLRFYGVTGPEPGVDPASPTRLVFGLVDPAAAHVTATGGIEQVGPLHPLPGTDLRLFVMRAGPAAGLVTVSDDAGHQVTQPVDRLPQASGAPTTTRR